MSWLRNGRCRSNPVPNTIPSNSSALPSEKVTAVFVIDAIHGRTVIRPSATSGRYCWLRVTPAAKSDGSGAGAPYCSGLPPASTTISFSCRSISAAGRCSFAMAPYRVNIRWSEGTPAANFGSTYRCRRWVTTTWVAPSWASSAAISRALIAPPATSTRLPK